MRAAMGWRPTVAVAVVITMLAIVAAGVAVAGTQPVTLPGTHPADPAVSGSRVVWADNTYGYYDIFCYDAATGVTRRLTFGGSDHVQPAISGNTVVWADYRAGDADIWGMDLTTGVEQPIVVAVDDQIHPSISGTRLAWEDYRNGYNPAVRVRDLATGAEIVLASGYNMPAKRPKVSGDIVVWEDYTAQALGRTDPDVKAYDFSTGSYISVANSARSEMLPATDGRYIVWAESNGHDLDVRALDTHTGRTRTIGAGPAEQTFPQVAAGVAYWLDNSAGKRLSPVTYNFSSGRLARFGDYGTSDVGALAADGGTVAWLAKTGADWKVRVLVPRSTVATTRLARLLPAHPAPLAGGAASAMGVSAPLSVVGTSVRRGALDVPRGSTFSVYFSKPLDPASVTASAVRVLGPSGRPVRGFVRYGALARAAIFTPASPLGAGTYTLSVSPMLADTAGTRMAVGMQVSFSTIHILADTIPPSAPPSIVASVAGTSTVALSWGASTDNVGVTGYNIYRSTAATPIANFPTDASLTLSVGPVTNATVPVKADEAAKSYCYYYVVTAVDGAGNESAPSYNGCPDPHGTYTAYRSTNLCMRCHSVHGAKPQLALGAKTAAACYVCHGNTPATGAYGSASTFDTQGDFGDDSAIATTGPDLTSGGSIHRNAYMVSIQRECDACHTPHRRPFNYDPTISYRRLLRTQVSTA
jgi:TolB protein